MAENKLNKTIYERPLSDVIDIRPERMLCTSDASGSGEHMDYSGSDL